MGLSLVRLCRLYLAGLIIWGLNTLVQRGPGLGPFLLLGAIVLLFRQRSRSATPFSFCPDPLLVCLPIFWSWNHAIHPVSETLTTIFLPHLCMVSAVLLSGGAFWLKSGFLNSPLSQGMVLSLGFILAFLTFVKLVYPPFSGPEYREILLEVFYIYGSIPICKVAATGLGFSWDKLLTPTAEAA